MFENDYILRMIMLATQGYKRLIALMMQKRLDEAEQELAEQAQTLVGMDIGLLVALPLEELFLLDEAGGSAPGLTTRSVAWLLMERSLLLRDSAPNEAVRIGEKALLLALGAPLLEEDISEQRQLFEQLIAGGAALEIGLEDAHALLERLQTLSRADLIEDWLFALAEEGYDGLGDLAVEAYGALENWNDEQLEAGGLPRLEMQEGRRALLKLTGQEED